MTTFQFLKPVFLSGVVISAFTMNLTRTNGTEAPQSKPESAEKSVEQLQQEHLAVLQQLVEVAFEAYKVGEADIAQGMQAQQQLLDAKLELAEDRDSRLKILADAVNLATEWQKVAEAQYRAAQTSQADVLQCRANSLKAEIALLREKKEQ